MVDVGALLVLSALCVPGKDLFGEVDGMTA